jgi:predicted flap endonuclease-1-like 5' DNA nuclease
MNVQKIEGIGPSKAAKLGQVGIRTTERLLKEGATRRGRQELAARTGISEALILEWVNLADLFRVKGIGEEYSDLLEEAGVDSVKELRHRRADQLYKKLLQVNAAQRLVRRPPAMSMVKDWIRQAKKLAPVIAY